MQPQRCVNVSMFFANQKYTDTKNTRNIGLLKLVESIVKKCGLLKMVRAMFLKNKFYPVITKSVKKPKTFCTCYANIRYLNRFVSMHLSCITVGSAWFANATD